MDYMSTDFGADYSSLFALQRGQTDRQTGLNALPTTAAIHQAWVKMVPCMKESVIQQ